MGNKGKYTGKFGLGDRYGKWTVINPNLEYNEKSQAKVTVKCDCGQSKCVYVTHLLSGKSKSCGCSNFERTGSNNPNFRGEGQLSGMKLKSVNLNNNTNFTATELSNLAQSQSYSCVWSGLPITTDFSNSTITSTACNPWNPNTVTFYINFGESNYIWAHGDIAKMKGDLSDEYFVELCHRVAERHPRPNPVVATAQEIANKVNQTQKKTNPVIEAAKNITKKYR